MKKRKKIKKNILNIFRVFLFIFIIVSIFILFNLSDKNKKYNNLNTQKENILNDESIIKDKINIEDFKYIMGLDISKFQGEIDFKKLKENNISFIFVKATEGEDFKDIMFDNNLKNGKSVNILMGAYHFYRLCENGKKQAEFFIKNVKKDLIDLPPVIDLELFRNCRNKNSIDFEIKEFKEFFFSLKNHYNTKLIIYTTIDTYSEFRKLFNTLNSDDHYLFVRITDRAINSKNYINIFGLSDEEEIRKIFEENWVFWQALDTYKIDGIEGKVDLDYFKGSIEELKSLYKK